MVDCNLFEPLRALDQKVLDEIVREGEVRLSAQLQIATAADQRALSIAAAQITSSTASLAGGIALALGSKPDWWLAGLAIAFAIGNAVAAQRAISSVRPKGFNIPGNRPLHWLPDRWMGSGAKHGHSLKQARIEQAACLDDEIAENRALMDDAAKKVKQSIDWWLGLVMVAAIFLVSTLVVRSVIICRPPTTIIRAPNQATPRA
jgi:hypothetical protein